MARIFGLTLPSFRPRLAVNATDFTARTIRTAHVAATLPDIRTATKLPEISARRPYEGTPLPVGTPRNGETGNGLPGRHVASDPLGDWYLNLPDKIQPKQISMILRQALAGNIWQQTQLARLMADTWPTFAKCSFELRAAIASTKYVVHAYAKPGQKPSASAQAKADFVQDALDSFEPNRFKDEDGFNGMIFDLTDAIINGVSVTEMLWNEDETNVRASAWVHPRNLAFLADGSLGIANAAESGNMSFSNTVRDELDQREEKYLVAKFKSKSGSFLGAGWMRKLVGYWVMIVYGRDFAMNFAQKYGNPFFDIAYDSNITNDAEIEKFVRFAEQAANQGFIVHPNNSTVEVGDAHGMAGDNAQIALMRLADEQCQYLMLGQTLTSAAPTNGGTRAQGDVHMDVRSERIEEHCKWMAREILTMQFAESLLRVNYGKSYTGTSKERPTIEADLSRPMTPGEQAEFWAKASSTKIPRLADETYKRAGCAQPQPGDLVISDLGITVMEEPVTATEKGQKDFDTQLEQQKAVHSEFGDPDGPDVGVQAALAGASAEELLELETLVVRAERATHRNGEHTLVEEKLKQLMERKRV